MAFHFNVTFAVRPSAFVLLMKRGKGPFHKLVPKYNISLALAEGKGFTNIYQIIINSLGVKKCCALVLSKSTSLIV